MQLRPTFRDELHENAEPLAGGNGIEIEHIREKNVRKEELVQVCGTSAGSHPGLCAIPVRRTSRGTTMNAFIEIGDWQQAQRIADGWRAKRIHRKLDEFAPHFCTIFRHLGFIITTVRQEPGSYAVCGANVRDMAQFYTFASHREIPARRS